MNRPAAPAPLVVFDLDGTLVDTAPDLIATLNIILAREGLAPLPYAVGRNLIGGGARKLIERGLAAEGRDASPETVSRLVTDFIDHYAEHIAEQSRPFEGLRDAMDLLRGEGFAFAVCTNKLEWLARRLLDALEMSREFATICGGDTFGVIKPDPGALTQTIERAGGTRTRAIMVGDSATDVNAARAAGIPVIGVSFGYTETPMAALAPDHLINHFDALPAAVRHIAANY